MTEVAVNLRASLHTMECGNCAMIFAVPRTFYDRCREDGRSFRCPNPTCAWTCQSYSEFESKRLKRELSKAQRRLDTERANREAAERREEHERRRASAFKGLVTRAKKGTCTVCNRSFANVARHMKSQHRDRFHEAIGKTPEIVDAEVEEGES